jgi:hypothetical protein
MRSADSDDILLSLLLSLICFSLIHLSALPFLLLSCIPGSIYYILVFIPSLSDETYLGIDD